MSEWSEGLQTLIGLLAVMSVIAIVIGYLLFIMEWDEDEPIKTKKDFILCLFPLGVYIVMIHNAYRKKK